MEYDRPLNCVAGAMTNIPTELLRTLVAVVDLRSFTKAAQSLGVTQPAVSAQIKRLQGLLGTELLDKSAPGVTLTSAGELVVNYARRLLVDQRSDPGFRGAAAGVADAADRRHRRLHRRQHLARPRVLSRAASATAVHRRAAATIDDLLREMRDGDLDVVVWVSPTGPTFEARHCWTEELVWVRGATMRLDDGAPVPLVSYGEECPFTPQHGGGAQFGRPRQRTGVHGLERRPASAPRWRPASALLRCPATAPICPASRSGRMRRCPSCRSSSAASTCVLAASPRSATNSPIRWRRRCGCAATSAAKMRAHRSAAR